MRKVVKAAHSTSALGPSRIPYGIYKHCPGLLQLLWKIIKMIWWRGRVADQWRFAEGVWIPKEENSKEIEQFRSIFCWVLKVKSFSAFYHNNWTSICWRIIILKLQYRRTGFQVFQDVSNIQESLPRYWGKPEKIEVTSPFCGWTSWTHTVPSCINW